MELMKPETKRWFKRHRYCNFIGTVFGVILVAPILIGLFDRREPVIFEAGRITPWRVRPGQIVEVHWLVKRFRNCEGEFRRRIIDASGTVHGFLIESALYPNDWPTDGNIHSFVRTWQLPKGLVNGPAFYSAVGQHWCNSLQKWLWPITFEAPWVRFQVDSTLPEEDEPIPNPPEPRRSNPFTLQSDPPTILTLPPERNKQ